MVIKGAIFDLDGVLFSGKDLHFEALNEVLLSIDESLVISRQDHEQRFNGIPTAAKLRMLSLERELDESLHAVINKKKQERFLSKLGYLEEVPAITETLTYLKNKNILIGVASNSVRATVDTVLGKMKLDHLVDVTLSNEDVKYPKPSPDIYVTCMKKLGVRPEETIIVEDSYVGKTAAKASGAHVMPVADPSCVTKKRMKSFLEFVKRGVSVNVVIPMAGHGSRFSVAGYDKPKPFIDVLGKPMIQHVVENINIDARYTFIVQEKHMKRFSSAQDTLQKLTTNSCNIIPIDGVTDGAARTVLLADKYVNNDMPLIVANSDQVVEDFDIYDFINKGLDSDGHILCFEDPTRNPKWSYAAVENGFVTEVAEKKPISDFATVGIYFFKKGSDFVEYANQMIDKDIRTNGEYYLCPVYNIFIKDNKKITIQLTENMHGLGTPSDLEAYIKVKNSI